MLRPVTTPRQIRRNTVLLALCLVTLSGVLQLAVAVATITLVLVTGIESILGLGPAIFLTAGALAALPAGRLMDRYGRVPVISGGFAVGFLGCLLTALGCVLDFAPLVILVGCRIVPGTKVPAIEQLMAAGAAAQNILLALHAQGYVAAWKTGEAAYDTEVKRALGLAADDHIVGFIYAGGSAGATFSAGKPASVRDAMLVFPG